jgi:hypothetical protein
MSFRTWLKAAVLAFLVPISAQADTATLAPVHDWRGPYVGVFIGTTFDSKSDAGLCQNVSPYHRCRDHDEDNYIPNFFNQYSHATQSGIAGVQVGYNIQFDHPKGYKWLPNVLGFEGELGRLNYGETIGGLGGPNWGYSSDMPGAADYTTDLTKYRFIGARAGYAVGQNLFYLKGGLVYTDMTTTFCSAATNDCQMVASPWVPGEFVEFGGRTGTAKGPGHAFGAGFERALPWAGGNKWSVKAEYLVMNLPSINTTGMGTNHGVPPFSYPTGLAIYQTLRDLRTFKISLDYKFNDLLPVDLANSVQAEEITLSGTHDWAGPYVAGFLGSTFNTKGQVDGCASRAWVPCGSDESYFMSDFSGLSDYAHADQSVTTGIQIGLNTQFNHPKGYQWLPNLLGIEAEIGHLNYYETIAGMTKIDPESVPSGRIPEDIDYETHVNNYGFLGGRAGYAFGQSLIYLKAGVVFSDMQAKSCSGPDGSCRDGRPGSTAVSKGPGTAFGIGYERAINLGGNGKWSAKAEYLTMSLPEIGTEGVGTLYGIPPEVYPLSFAIRQKMDDFRTFKIGLSYKF